MNEIYEKLNQLGEEMMDLIWLVPVMEDLKPVAQISAELGDPDEYENFLNKTGLVYLKFEDNLAGKKLVSFFVGKNKDDIEELKNLFYQNGKEKRAGELLGIPETAIEGYINKDLLPVESEPEEIKKYPMRFRLSNYYWKDEIEVMKKWNETAKEKVPKLYDLWAKNIS